MPLRVILASAGSGKTETLATSTLSALKEAARQESVDEPSGVLAITFTRNAAAELRERILQKAHQQQETDLLRQIILGRAPLYTSTIDAFTREMYYRLAPLLGLPAYTSLIVEAHDTAEAVFTIVEFMLAQLSEPARLQLLRKRIQSYLWEKGRRVFPEELLEEAVEAQLREGPLRSRIRLALYQWIRQQGNPSDTELPWYRALKLRKSDAALAEWVFQATQAYRELARRLFLSDMQAVVQLVARKAPFLLAEQAYFFRELLIDEAQDTSPAQWELLQPLFAELQAKGGQITLIGDPKQSIYAWRDADFRQLLRYAKRAEKIILNTNYRSHNLLVCFNNRLYTQLPLLLQRALDASSKKRRKNDDTDSLRREAVRKIRELYQPATVRQKATRPPKVLQDTKYHNVISLEAEADESCLRSEIEDILVFLEDRGIPPEETAFLVRRNRDIQMLFRLLPDYPLQLQSVALETCTTLAATMALLEQLPPSLDTPLSQESSVEAYFLLQQPNADALREALVEVQKTFVEKPASHLSKWMSFYGVASLWLKDYSEHAPFWNLFLSELYSFLAKHPFYGLAEVLRWWHSRARKMLLNLPPTKGVYPVLTIHRAKGLAWDAVILPFVSWELMRASKVEVRWYRVPKSALPPTLAQTLRALEDLSYPKAWELPLVLSKSEPSLEPLYTEAYITNVVESINLHYVATTRPREYLFLITQEPRGRAFKGVNTWAGFWTEIYPSYGTGASK